MTSTLRLSTDDAELLSVVESLTEDHKRQLLELIRAWSDGEYEELSAATLAQAQLRFGQIDLGSKTQPSLQATRDIADWHELEASPGLVVRMPPPDELPGRPFSDLVAARRSQREFGNEPISVADLSTLLHLAAGVTAEAIAAYGLRKFPFRTYPSAGGLQSVSIFVYVRNVQSIEDGIYQYVPTLHALKMLERCEIEWKLSQLSPPTEWAWSANVTAVLVANLRKLRWKYGAHSYRLAHLDSGVLLESLTLAAEALGWANCSLGTFVEDRAYQNLRLDPRDWIATALFVTGPGRKSHC